MIGKQWNSTLSEEGQCESWTHIVSCKGPSVVFLGCQASKAAAGEIIACYILYGLTICCNRLDVGKVCSGYAVLAYFGHVRGFE